jgi:hypothetical protein
MKFSGVVAIVNEDAVACALVIDLQVGRRKKFSPLKRQGYSRQGPRLPEAILCLLEIIPFHTFPLDSY